MYNRKNKVWIKKSMVLVALFLYCFITGYSQEEYDTFRAKVKKQYANFQKQSSDKYLNFRQKANSDYAEFMRKSWEQFHASPAIPQPQSPDPVTPPVIKDPNEKPVNNPVPQGKIEPMPDPPVQPQPLEKIPVDSILGQKQYLDFKFYNISGKVYWNDSLRFRFPDLEENTIALAWELLSGKEYNEFVVDCIQLRSKLALCDWAFIELLQQITGRIFDSPKSNEAVFLQMFVLCQTGYKVRIASADGSKLVLLVSTDYMMYNHEYLEIEEDTFYVIDSESKQYSVFNKEYPNEQSLSLRIDSEPILDQVEAGQKIFASKRFPGATAKTGVNKGLIDFYNTYPRCEWKVYANTPLSETIQRNIYPVLEYAIKGKTETEAANILINFVQTSFDYKTDDDQFGYERPFFPDELFYYPYSDCEDRAILFSTLVRDLLHLKVVLLHYPNHLATAVHFNQEIEGDYLMVNNLKYLVCDPTYIDAPIGLAMPQFKNTTADVVEMIFN